MHAHETNAYHVFLLPWLLHMVFLAWLTLLTGVLACTCLQARMLAAKSVLPLADKCAHLVLTDGALGILGALQCLQAFKSIVPGVLPLLEGVEANYRYWKSDQQRT